MNRNARITLLISAVLASAVGLAIAAPQSGNPAARSMADANGDGVITRAEAAAHPRLAQRFDQLDRNKDGKLNADERPQRGMQRGGRDGGRQGMHGRAGGMQRWDTDNDGRISRVEAVKAPSLAARFDSMDMNKDGFIDLADRAARHAQRSADCFNKADTDKSGQLSRAEFFAVRDVCGRGQGGMRGR